MSRWQPGERIEKRWEVQHVLEGGCGIVYVVFDDKFRWPFAVKTFKEMGDAGHDHEAFIRESTAWIRLDHHPHVVQAYFALHLAEKPHLFLDYVAGGNLRQWIAAKRNRGRVRDGLRLAIQICDGLAHIYAHGIAAHRDIKPENFLLTAEEDLKVTDFGLVSMQAPNRDLGARGLHTQPGGTPAYMPPEQFLVGSVDKSADVYALGIVLFEILTGRHPFADWLGPADEPWKWLQVHQRVVPDLERSGLPARLQTLIERCLAKDFRNRYPSVDPIRAILAEEYCALAGAPIPQPSARPLTSTELGLKAAGLFEVGLLSEGAECLIRILDLDESQDDLFLCYERVASLLEQFKFSSPGWGAGVGAVLLCGLAPGRAFIKGPVSGFAEALHALEEISSTNALHPGALEMKARLLLIAGQYKEALPAFRLAIASGHADETRRIKLVTLPLHQAGIWKREFKKQPDAGTHIAQCTWLAANLGHPHAQCDLGFMHMAGKGMEQSMFQAFVWFMLAARAGESRAVAPLEEVYTFLQKDEYFQLDAKRPSALAQAKHNLGAAYYFGTGTEQNYPEAANWFREAAEMGSADSKYNLGLMYKNGQGVEKDLVLAYVWLHRAALQGDPDASAMRDAVAAAMSPDQVATASVLVERQN